MDLSPFLNELRHNGYEPVRELQVNSATWPRLRYNDEKSPSGGYKLIENTDGSLFANYGSSKDPAGWRSWRSDSSRELTWQEMAAAKSARESHRQFLEENERKRHAVVGARLTRVLDNSPIATTHPYLTDKGVQAHGIRMRKKTGELLIPRYDIDGKIYGLQRIIQRETGIKSWKGYFKNARSKGLFYPLYSTDENMAIIVLAEGFSTAASVRECTGFPVLCCFDAGGLRPVALTFKKKYPDSRFIFAADADIWPNAKGIVSNTGLEKSRSAAAGIGGAHVIWPEFQPEHHEKKPTDWNDALLLYGVDYVKRLFDKILEIPVAKAPEETPAGGNSDPLDSVVQATGGVVIEKGDMGMAFRVLGYNNGQFYYFPFASRQIVCLSASAHTMQNLMQLDRLESWESGWRGDDGKLTTQHNKIAMYAADRLMAIAKKKGVFQAEDRIRGVGAWIDDGRVVLHCGDCLFVDGQNRTLDNIDSYYMYIASVRLLRPGQDVLTNQEAARLRTICESVTWENPMSGSLLAGWLVIAPICAALEWRPHICITGEALAGKSTVLKKIITPVLGKLGLYVDGKTSEPSIREKMGYNARPLVFDEAEPSLSIEAVFDLARLASSGGTVTKSGKDPFVARFCACFSAINPPVKKTADESRISFMVIKRNRKANAQDDYNKLLEAIEETITDGFAERMIARTLQNIDALITNIRIFKSAFRKVTHEARAADQIAPMLAGLYLLGRTNKISEEDAEKWISRWDWEDHSTIHQPGDPLKLVQYLAESLVRPSTGTAEISIGDLIEKVHIERDSPAERLLGYYGIKVKDGRVYIASSSHNLAKILRDTEWNIKWSRTLSDVPNARKEKSEYFSRGVRTSGVSLPVEMFITREEEFEPEAIEF